MILRLSASPFEMFSSLWRHRELTKALSVREVLVRYRSSVFGLLWSFINPLLILAVFTYVFSVIFQFRWGGGGDSKIEFALALFAGMIIFNLFSECVNRAPILILSNSNYVTKVVFPLEIIPFVSLMSALFHALVSFGIWIIVYIIVCGVPHLTIIYFPIVLVPLVFFTAGLSWILASLGVFLRDISQVTGVLTTGLMFMSPVLYPSTAFPEEHRYILYFNPITIVVEQTRDVLLWGNAPNFLYLAVYFSASLFVASVGFVFFQKTRKGFADVI